VVSDAFFEIINANHIDFTIILGHPERKGAGSLKDKINISENLTLTQNRKSNAV
jgi:hypothetical protein